MAIFNSYVNLPECTILARLYCKISIGVGLDFGSRSSLKSPEVGAWTSLADGSQTQSSFDPAGSWMAVSKEIYHCMLSEPYIVNQLVGA